MSPKKKPSIRNLFSGRPGKKRDSLKNDGSLAFQPDCMAKIKPREKLVFHSDYFQIDNCYASILSFFHTPGADDAYCPFWGVARFPDGMPDGISVIVLDQVSRMSESWIRSHQNAAESVAEKNLSEQHQNGTSTSRHRSFRSRDDLETIARELNNGDAYLNVKSRLLIKAESLELLEEAVERLERKYTDVFTTLSAAAYQGDQRSELAGLFARNERKKGKGFFFTSSEYAGSYHLVSHGLEEKNGEYVGTMIDDINTSAIFMDINDFSHHVVIASEQVNTTRIPGKRLNVCDLWGSKLSQACMKRNGRVVHLVLNSADLDDMGPAFEGITCRIDMNSGDLNPFEMFGDPCEELSVIPAQMEKLKLMALQVYPAGEQEQGALLGSLEKTATEFYIGQGMWKHNAARKRKAIRVVNLPHEQVPRLQDFVMYLQKEYDALLSRPARDEEALHAAAANLRIFSSMLDNNGDLFNCHTSSKIDHAKQGLRVIYSFSHLEKRGGGAIHQSVEEDSRGIAMAQLVNVMSFACSHLEKGDLLIVHGAELLDAKIMGYLAGQLRQLYRRGARSAFLYGDMQAMLDAIRLNQFDKADYTVLGGMSLRQVGTYQQLLEQEIPQDLVQSMARRSATRCCVRKGVTNVVFEQDLQLDGLYGRGDRP